MNPLSLEQAMKTALAAAAFTTEPIYTGTSYAELTPESTNLIVTCENAQQQGVGLFVATVSVKIIAPALLGSNSYSAFSALLASMRDALTNEYMTAHWPTPGDYPAFLGLWLENVATSQNQNEWEAVHTVSIGLGI